MTATRSTIVANHDALLDHGFAELRGLVLDVIAAGLEASDPAEVVRDRVGPGPSGAILVDDVEHRHGPAGRIFVIGAGKASARIAGTLEDVLGDRIAGGVVAIPDGSAPVSGRIEFVRTAHPLPDEASRRAALRIMEIAHAAHRDDVFLACFTGGSSALACLPPEGVDLEEKRDLHQLLLSSGAPIREVNAVRKHVSAIKGGRLAAAIGEAAIVNLTVSDVAGDPLDAITDPTVQDTTTCEDAVRVLRRYHLWDRVAPSIRRHLASSPAAESPELAGASIRNTVLITGSDVAEAMARRSAGLGIRAHVISTSLEGESREVGAALAAIAAEVHDHGRPFRAPCLLLGAGGETTVTLDREGVFGRGGPNQTAALAAALRIGSHRAIAAGFVDSDGIDGGSPCAGALVDASTVERAASLGLDLRDGLRRHASSETLSILGDSIVTGPTGTNVNDLFALAVGSTLPDGNASRS